LLPLGFLTFGTSAEECGGDVNPATGAALDSCTDGGTDALQVIGIVVVALAIVLAVATPIWLGSRLRKRLGG
jgi:hypothetical protein